LDLDSSGAVRAPLLARAAELDKFQPAGALTGPRIEDRVDGRLDNPASALYYTFQLIYLLVKWWPPIHSA